MSIYYARYNGFGGSGSGVTSLNGLTGILSLAAGTGISITPSGSTITITNTESPGTGTVTSVSVVSANGFAGTVANPTTTPAITLSTTVTGILLGNGTSISAATPGTDYVIPSGSITGTAGNITATSNSTLTTLSALSLPYSQITGAPAAGITQLTGDVTAGPGSGSQVATLATVNSDVGTFALATVTVNAKGLTTAASAATTTGSGAVVLATSPTLITPALGTPSSATLTNALGLPVGGIAAIAADTLIGNNTGSSAIPSALTVSQVNTLLGTLTNPMTTAGDIIYGGASGAPTRLAGNITTATQILMQTGTGSASAAPVWTTAVPVASGGTGNTSGGMIGTNWASYTPTFVGFGTVVVQNFNWRRVGGSIEIIGYFTSGITTATTASITLPGSLSTSSIITSTQPVGQVNTGNAQTGAFYLLAGPSSTTLNFGFSNGTGGGVAVRNGNDIVGSATQMGLQASVPISGYSWNT